MRVLIVEDARDLATNIAEFLAQHEVTTRIALDGDKAMAAAAQERFSVVVLDLSLPDVEGLELCRKLQATGPGMKVLMLTARDTEADKLRGFDAGADDYLTKPFSLPELLARIRALARRGVGPDEVLRIADLSFDLRTLHLQRGSRVIRLPGSSLRLLQRLMEISPQVLSREAAAELLWGKPGIRSEAALRGHIHAIRCAIDDGFDLKLLHTLHGVGYRLSVELPE